MKKTSHQQRQTGSRIRALLSAVLALIILLTAMPVCITAGAATIITYKVEVTSESKASGWNSARLELHYKDRSGNVSFDDWDIKNDISKGYNVTKIVPRYDTDKVPYMIRLYLDFGGGFTIRSHSGRVKLYVEGQEIMNEAYSARSYPFSSSNETMDFAIYGLVPAEVISADGSSKSYATVQQAWDEAKNIEGSAVKLSRNSTIKGTLEVSNNMKIDLNGCLFANAEVGPLFHVKSGGNLSIIDSDPTRDTGETFLCTTGMTSEEEADARTYPLKGGGIYHGGSEESGGAVKVDAGGELSVNGCTFTDCHSSDSGGAIYCEGKITLDRTRFIYCTSEEYGGAICLSNKLDPSFQNLTFERCSADYGGGISFVNIKNKRIFREFDNCVFNYCKAVTNGGGISFAAKIEAAANNLTFFKCEAESGGGLYNVSSQPISLNNGKFKDCSATESGGALGYKYGGEMTLNNVEIDNCKSSLYGGGICLVPIYNSKALRSSDVNIRNCDIHNCSSGKEGGGIYVYDDGNDIDETNKTNIYNTLVRNNSSETGGGVYVESNYVYLIGSSVTKNQAESKNGGGVYVDSMYDIELAEDVVIRDNLAKLDINNLCLQNGIASTAYAYCGGLYDGAYIGISSTGNSNVTVVKNISQFQASKFIHSDDYQRRLSMTNTREVDTPLFASMISENASFLIILGGVVVIAGAIGVLYFRKRRKESNKNDRTDD